MDDLQIAFVNLARLTLQVAVVISTREDCQNSKLQNTLKILCKNKNIAATVSLKSVKLLLGTAADGFAECERM